MKYFILLKFLLSTIYLVAQVKITCEDVKLATKPLKEVTYVQAIETRIESTFEACQLELRNDLIVESHIHPFIDALYISFATHRRISISPDMIWLMICQGFSTHVNQNTEKLRSKFVDFNDKKKLIVNTDLIEGQFIKGSISSPWPSAFNLMADSISKYVKPNIYNLYVQSFSTTTPTIKSAYEVSLLDVMSGYFEYEYFSACGIPEIIIEGTTEDWKKIKRNIRYFKGYGIDNWVKALDKIINQFVNASQNKIDHDFWSNIFKKKEESGGPYITGWIIKFFPYVTEYGNKLVLNEYIDRDPEETLEGLTTNQFNNGLSKVDFIWNYFDKKYEMEFMAGFIGIKQDPKSLILRPEIGWAVKDKFAKPKSPKNIEKNKLNEKIIKKEENVNWTIWISAIAVVIISSLTFWIFRRRLKKPSR